MLIISIGMPRSGTLWRYNLIRELIIANGGMDGLEIRQKFFLQKILGERNVDINTLKPRRLIPALIPSWLGKTYVANSHAGPRPMAERLVRKGKLKIIYGYRDPRACILSMLEYSQRVKANYSAAQFLQLNNVQEAVQFISLYLEVWDGWMEIDEVLKVRYEDMLSDYQSAFNRIVEYLGIEKGLPGLEKIAQNYLPRQLQEGGPTMHLEVGIAERFRDAFPKEDQDYLNEIFKPYLARMGYQE